MRITLLALPVLALPVRARLTCFLAHLHMVHCPGLLEMVCMLPCFVLNLFQGLIDRSHEIGIFLIVVDAGHGVLSVVWLRCKDLIGFVLGCQQSPTKLVGFVCPDPIVPTRGIVQNVALSLRIKFFRFRFPRFFLGR